MHRIDEELLPLVEQIPRIDLARDGIPAARATFAAMSRSAPDPVLPRPLIVEDRIVAGPAPPVPVRLYRPAKAPDPAAGLVMLHGGGFVMGGLDTDDRSARVISATLGVVVVSVDYRLAPEHPYPAAVEDVYAVVSWLSAHAESVGVDPGRIGISGTSAGGGLAAACTLLARDRAGPEVRFQCLDVPALDDRLDTPSMLEYVDTPVWHRANAQASWQHYLGAAYQPGSDHVPLYAAPARAVDLRDLPPTFVSTCQYDPLRDEGIAYAQNLLRCGVPTELVHYPGTFHGSARFTGASVSERMVAHKLDALKRGLGIASG